MTRESNDDRFHTLAEHALQRTESGALDWEETPQEESFVAIFGSGMLKVSRTERLTPSFEDDGDAYYQDIYCVSLLTRTANEVMELLFDGFNARDSLGGRLWQAARGRARGAEDLLDSVLREVDGPEATTAATHAAA
ncbi:hypothetical protein [Alienimonas chondri]|uniref:Uncharacterized protein n=1 Tax=Alienimonas chondri TaxID=2681879 RepID=A0ABX1VND3_9PLAN|nr:hypothetical protein [Alienimonas chondri]NNJ28118.1 hypothetical protein [Alienimonas chondri]